MSRDYATEMRAVIDAEAIGSYAAPVIAAHIVEKLRTTDADLLRGWLDEQAVNFVRHAINLRDCSTRSHNRTAIRRSVFRQAAEDFESGDAAALTTNFLDEPYLVESGSKMPLGDMRRPELRFAADDYERRENENGLQKAFLRALDKKVGNRRVRDAFSEDQLVQMWRSIAGH